MLHKKLSVKSKNRQRLFLQFTTIILLIPVLLTTVISAENLPVKDPESFGYTEQLHSGIINLLTIDMLQTAIKDGTPKGLLLDFSDVKALTDGTQLNQTADINGIAYVGPYPFESEEVSYTYKRFRNHTHISNGTAIIPLSLFLSKGVNSENWKSQGRVVIRMELFLSMDNQTRFLGLYDTYASFKLDTASGIKRYVKSATIIEGPMVNRITSDDPTSAVIAFKTNEEVKAKVILNNEKTFFSPQANRKHEIILTGLEPDREYKYYVAFDDFKGKANTFRTAPRPGVGEVVFAYAGDSREGVGGGTYNFMGVNYQSLERIVNTAFNLDADIFLFGGDLVRGYTTSTVDFRTQLHAFKQAFDGFWRQRPVFACIGNHEIILKVHQKKDPKTGKTRTFFMDRWPYETESVEAVFADELVNPLNAPEPSDPRRPSYKETVFSFQYGPVKFIAFNNNYWLGRVLWERTSPSEAGGCPEGYVMADQMQWIRNQLNAAEKDPTVKYIILFAQEPVFPNGGHVNDCMWYDGDNTIKPYTYDANTGKMTAPVEGIIDNRNQLVLLVSQCKKVAAVLGSDEHSYHKVLIDRNVPIGVPALDDPQNTGQVCGENGTCSPLKELKYPTWYLVSGGAGAPYYSEDPTPWNTYWKNATPPPDYTSMRGCFYYSSQENFMVFKAGQNTISVKVYNPYGEIIDSIDDLMKVKHLTGD